MSSTNTTLKITGNSSHPLIKAIFELPTEQRSVIRSVINIDIVDNDDFNVSLVHNDNDVVGASDITCDKLIDAINDYNAFCDGLCSDCDISMEVPYE